PKCGEGLCPGAQSPILFFRVRVGRRGRLRRTCRVSVLEAGVSASMPRWAFQRACQSRKEAGKSVAKFNVACDIDQFLVSNRFNDGFCQPMVGEEATDMPILTCLTGGTFFGPLSEPDKPPPGGLTV